MEYAEYQICVRIIKVESIIIIGQRTFDRHPADFTVYLLADQRRELAAFECDFGLLDYGSTPNITWEYRSSSTGTIVPLELSGSTAMVLFQYDHTGYFQLQSPTSSDDGSQVRCVATDPDSTDQVVQSNWATVIISGMYMCTFSASDRHPGFGLRLVQ